MNYLYRFSSYVFHKIWPSKEIHVSDQAPNKKKVKKHNKTKPYRKQHIPKTIRNQVWRKYCGNMLDGKCFCCCQAIKYESWEAGHIVAEVNGGQTNLENLRPICIPCNRSMGKTNMIEFMKRYHMSGLKNI